MKKIALFILFFSATLGNAQMINNFENGLTSVSVGTFRNQNGIPFSVLNCDVSPTFGTSISPLFTNVNMPAEKASVVTAVNEPILAGYNIFEPCVGPNGDKFALRLNNVTTGSQDITAYEQTFTAVDEYVSFEYMAVLDSNHTNNIPVQPFFTVRLLDGSNTVIQSTDICIVADPNEPILENINKDIFFTKGWYCGLIKIPSYYLNQNIKIQFIVADCGDGGHRGVVYIDNIINEKKCDTPAYGFIELNEVDNICNPEAFEITGTYTEPQGAVFTDAHIEILQNGVPVAVNPGSLSSGSFNNGQFAFGFNVASSGLPYGSYEIRVVAHFTAPNGYVYELVDESANAGADFVLDNGNNAPLNVTIVHDEIMGVQSPGYAEWDNTGGIYYIEAVSDGYCCPGKYEGQTIDGVIYSIITEENTLENLFYQIGGNLKSKCFRFRVRTDCKEWSTWCCVTSYEQGYEPGQGGYDTSNSNDPFNTCLDQIDLDNLIPATSAASFALYPNPVTDEVTIINAQSTVFTVYDMRQQAVKTYKTPHIQEKTILNLSELKPGTYILRVNGKQTDLKIIKQ